MHEEPLSVISRPLEVNLSAVDVLRLVRGDAHPVALLGAWAGGSDIIAANPVRVTSDPPPFATHDPLSPAERNRGSHGIPPGVAARFGGGWIGYLGYGASARFLPVPPAPGGPRRLPDAWWGYYDHVLRRDRASGQWFFEALADPGRAAVIEARFDEIVSRVRSVEDLERGFSCGPFGLVPSAGEHREAVRKTVEYIRAGDIFQANICLRLEASFSGDPLDAFCAAATRLDPRYAAFLRLPGGGAVASLSPELFLRRSGDGDQVLSSPIKGTRVRPADAEAAQASREELIRSAKDGAENVMIVDLMRNDLSRVGVPGSVEVPALLRAEPHPGVWHLVSDVTGRLAAGADDAALIAATFPPGSVTGAPKVRALEIIHELEAVPREAYTGAIGYRSPVAGLELNVAIRTFEFCGSGVPGGLPRVPGGAERGSGAGLASGTVWLGAGGGITARSDPDAEFRECLVKAAPLVAALGAVISAEATDLPGSGAPGQIGTLPSQEQASGRYEGVCPALQQAKLTGEAAVTAALRPRPAAGVFTSLRVSDGRVADLAGHLARLEASAVELYGKRLPAGVGDQLAALLASRPSGRLRMTAQPVGGPLQVRMEVVPTAPAARTVNLRPVVVPGGIGPQKWRDRRLLSRLSAEAGLAADEHLLIVDANGDVLETDRANVFAVIGGVLHTPPLDGRLLPGVTRAAVLRLAAEQGIPVKEAPLSVAQLAEATEVFAVNSVYNVIPARGLSRPAHALTARPDGRGQRDPHQAPEETEPAGLRSGGGAGELRLDGVAVSWDTGPVTLRLREALARRPASLARGSAPTATQLPAMPHGDAGVSSASRSRTFMYSRPLIVLVDNYDSFTYNLAHLLLGAGCEVEVVRNDEVAAADIAMLQPAGIVISPGPCAPAEAGISIDVVRECGPVIPVLGICLGHQAIAAAYGGQVVRASSPAHGFASPVSHDGSGVLAGLPPDFAAARYHSLVVEEGSLPADLLVTARLAVSRGGAGETGIVMGLRHAVHPVAGLQFHPESILTVPHGAVIIANFVRGTRARGM
jgi:para-aminobenzoate synthetase / 4-amino-4-deoxychorismate lyase